MRDLDRIRKKIREKFENFRKEQEYLCFLARYGLTFLYEDVKEERLYKVANIDLKQKKIYVWSRAHSLQEIEKAIEEAMDLLYQPLLIIDKNGKARTSEPYEEIDI